MFQYTNGFTSSSVDSINTGVIYNIVENPTKNNMYVDNNLLVDK